MFGHYVRAAFLNIRRSPVSAAIKLIALSLGLVCFLSAYVFSAFIARADMHWEKADRILFVSQYMAGAGGEPARTTGAGMPVAELLRLDFPELEAAARLTGPSELTLSDPERGEIPAAFRMADPELTDIFDLAVVAGDPARALREPNGAILAADAARRLFGGEDPIGETLTLNATIPLDLTVMAVIEEPPAPSLLGRPFGHFDVLASIDLQTRMMASQSFDANPEMARLYTSLIEATMNDWRTNPGYTFVLLPEDGSLTARRMAARLDDFVARRAPPEVNVAGLALERPQTVVARGFNRLITYGPDGQVAIRATLAGFGALVLAVACLNFANLATAEAARRAREIGLRKTLGAGRAQIALQTLTETALLVVAASALTLVIIALALFAAPDETVGLAMTVLSGPGFWAGIAMVLGGVILLAGAYPSLVLAGVRPQAAQRMGGRGRGWTVRTLLIGAQFVTAGALLAGIFVIALQNAELRRTGLGSQDDLLVLIDHPTPAALLDVDLTANPAIKGHTTAYFTPFAAGAPAQQEVRLSPDEAAPGQSYQDRSVRWNFFDVVDADLVAGRTFTEDDLFSDKAIIDGGTARRLGLAPAEAVGQTAYLSATGYQIGDDGEVALFRNIKEVEVIGVIGEPVMELATSGGPENFFYSPTPGGGAMSLVRMSRDNVSGGLAYLEDTWNRVAPGEPMPVRFLDEAFDEAFRIFNWVAGALAALCVMALVIAAMGLFGLASFVVRQRQREIGVRKTLGASSGGVLRLLLWDFSRPVAVANLIAWPIAYVAAQEYLNLFVTRIPLTPLPFLASLAGSLAIAWIAVGAQSWRAASAEPAKVLRFE